MSHPVDHMLTLWTTPPSDGSALERFRAVYADPYRVNGTPIAVEAIVERVRSMYASLAQFEQVVVDRIDEGARTALLLSQSGIHVGPLPTPLGMVAPTGRHLTRRLVEFITHDHQLLIEVTAVADDLDRLRQAGVVSPLT